jgi:hypothetical protein
MLEKIVEQTNISKNVGKAQKKMEKNIVQHFKNS